MYHKKHARMHSGGGIKNLHLEPFDENMFKNKEDVMQKQLDIRKDIKNIE